MAVENARRPNELPENPITADSLVLPIPQEYHHVNLGEQIIIEPVENPKNHLDKVRNMVTAYKDTLKPNQFSHLLHEMMDIKGAVGKMRKINTSQPSTEDNRYLTLKTTLGNPNSDEYIDILKTFGKDSPDLVTKIHTLLPRENPTAIKQILSEYISMSTVEPDQPVHIHREVRTVINDLDTQDYPRDANETDILRKLGYAKEGMLTTKEQGAYAKEILTFYDKLHPVRKD